MKEYNAGQGSFNHMVRAHSIGGKVASLSPTSSSSEGGASEVDPVSV